MGVNGSELLVIAVLGLLVIGPERLPHYASQLARLVRELRRMAQGAKAQVQAELGPEFDDVDWQKLDPRQYDPRRIVRDALTEVWEDEDDEPAPRVRSHGPGSRTPGGQTLGTGPSLTKPASRPDGRPGGGASRPGDVVGPAPFDADAT